MLVVYVGQNEEECGAVAHQLRGSRAPLKIVWAHHAMELMTFNGPPRATVILGSDLAPFERLRLTSWLGMHPDMLAIALGVPVRGVPLVSLDGLSPRTLIERAQPVVSPHLPLAA